MIKIKKDKNANSSVIGLLTDVVLLAQIQNLLKQILDDN